MEDVYTFDAEQLTSDFVLTHGHIWYYLVTHQFDIHETTALLKPLCNSVQKRKEKSVLYCKIEKLSNELKRLRCLVSSDRKFEDFKQQCKELFVCPSDIAFSDETISTSQENTMTTTLLTPHATPVKVLTEDISSLLSTPAKTHYQKQVTIAKNARRNLFFKDRQVSFWKNTYRALATSMKANVLRSIKEKLQHRNIQIEDLKLKLAPTRTTVRNERNRLKYAFTVAEGRKTYATSKLALQQCQAERINLVHVEKLAYAERRIIELETSESSEY